MSKLLSSIFDDIRPNLLYDIAKYLAFGAIAMLVAGVAFLYRYLRGYPRDLVLIAFIFVVAFFLMIVAVAVARYMRKRESQTSTKEAKTQGTHTAPGSCSDQWLHDIANAQATDIRDSIEIVSVGVWTHELHSALPTIRCGLLIKNNSLFSVSIESEIAGHLYFNRHKLAERKFASRIVKTLPSRHDAEMMFDQRLSKPEAELIDGHPNGRFDFSGLAFTVKSNENDQVQPQEMTVAAQYRPLIDEIISQSVLEVRESESLKTTALGIPRGKLVISRAIYGAGDDFSKWENVAEVLRSMIYANGTRLRLSDKYNDIFKCDPMPGVHKTLRIDYVHDGRKFFVALPENAKVTIPIAYSIP